MNKDQTSPSEDLMTATARGDLEAMRALIAGGADVNGADPQGVTPLMLAAYYWKIDGGFRDGVRLLLDAGADVDAANVNGQTALMISSIYGIPEMAEMLLAKGADIDKAACTGMTAEDMARQNGQADVVALLQKERAARGLRTSAEKRIKRVENYLKERARNGKKSGFKP